MSIRDHIERARQAQQDHPQKHPVQLELREGVTLWASEEETTDHFMETTFTSEEAWWISMHEGDVARGLTHMGHFYDDLARKYGPEED